MYVRTMYLTTDPARVGPALDVIAKESPGLLAEHNGYRGLGVFADRPLGKIVVGSWWESEQAERESDELLKARRRDMLTPLVDTIFVDRFEAAVADRPQEVEPGACFRLGRFTLDPSTAEQFVRMFEEFGLPGLRTLDGYKGGSLLIDRSRGYGSVGTIFKDHATLASSRGPQSALRREAMSRTGAKLLCLEEFDVVDLEIPTR